MTIQQDKDTQFNVDIQGFDPATFEKLTNHSPSDQPGQWQDPQPVLTTLLAVQSMEKEMIPESIRPWLTDIAHRMKCPLDYVVVAATVMISSLIGTRLAIKPKTKDDWTLIPNLWGAVIGDPSSMKTPSVSEVFKPLGRLMAEARKQIEQQMLSWEAEQVTHDVQKKVFQSQEQDRLKGKAVESPVSFPEPVSKPTERRYMTNDATIEKIGELLNENPAGLLQYRDELMGLFAGWERAGREQDRTMYLEAWNGNGSFTIDRIGRGTFYIKNVCISLFGGIQPGKLLGLLKAAMSSENDGFVQRLQLAVYPDKPQWEYMDESPDTWARQSAYKLIERIVESDFSSVGFPADEWNKFPYTRFDAPAQEVFKNWSIQWETQVLPNETGLLAEHFTKYRALMPSLALIFHLINFDYEAGPPADPAKKILVTEEAAKMAVKWCTYLQSHARRIYGLLDTISLVAAKDLLRHLKNGDLKDGFKVRDVTKKGWTSLNTTESVESALAELIDRFWVKEVMAPLPVTGRPEASSYKIHPTILPNQHV